MKQFILLVAIYSLILNQSNKKSKQKTVNQTRPVKTSVNNYVKRQALPVSSFVSGLSGLKSDTTLPASPATHSSVLSTHAVFRQ